MLGFKMQQKKFNSLLQSSTKHTEYLTWTRDPGQAP